MQICKYLLCNDTIIPFWVKCPYNGRTTISGYNGLIQELNIHILRFSNSEGLRPPSSIFRQRSSSQYWLAADTGFLPWDSCLQEISFSQPLYPVWPTLNNNCCQLKTYFLGGYASTHSLLRISWRFPSGLKPVPDILVSSLWRFP